jgi:hypothetical protein
MSHVESVAPAVAGGLICRVRRRGDDPPATATGTDSVRVARAVSTTCGSGWVDLGGRAGEGMTHPLPEVVLTPIRMARLLRSDKTHRDHDRDEPAPIGA